MKQLQSYDSIIFAHNFTVYEMRIMLKVVKFAQELVRNKGLGAKFSALSLGGDGENTVFEVPLTELLASKSHNYKYLKSALLDMQRNFIIQYYDRESRVWRSTSFLYNCSIEERSGLCKFSVANWLLGYIVDTSRGGYRLYDYDVAMSLHNVYTSRLYLLTSSQTKTLYYSLDALKKVLGLEGKYSRSASFVQRVLEPARHELANKKLNGFDYEEVRRYPQKQRSEVLGYRITPVRRENVSESDSKDEIASTIPAHIVSYLARQNNFSWREIKHIQQDIVAFMQIGDWENKLEDICRRAKRKNRSKGWIVKAIRSEVNLHNK